MPVWVRIHATLSRFGHCLTDVTDIEISIIPTFDIFSISAMSLGDSADDLDLEAILASPCVSHGAVDLMQQSHCEPEDRLGSQASSSVVCPNSMIVQARRSAPITPSGATRGGDCADLIKASRARKSGGSSFLILLTQFWGQTLSFVALTGPIFIVTPAPHSVPNTTILRTLGTLMTTFQLRCVQFLHFFRRVFDDCVATCSSKWCSCGCYPRPTVVR